MKPRELVEGDRQHWGTSQTPMGGSEQLHCVAEAIAGAYCNLKVFFFSKSAKFEQKFIILLVSLPYPQKGRKTKRKRNKRSPFQPVTPSK